MLRRLSIRIVFVGLFLSPAAQIYAAGNPVGFIDTPDSCLAVRKVTATEIHLSAVGKCDGKPGRAFVELEPGVSRTVVVDNNVIGEQAVHPIEVSDVSAALDKGLKDAESIQVPTNEHTKDMEQAAKSTSDLYYSQEYQDKLKAETERLRVDMYGGQVPTYYSDVPETRTGERSLGEDERVYIFISSSMPVSVLRTYAADVAKLKDKHVILVMRGFINGMEKISPTVSFFAEVLKKSPNCEIGPGKQCDMNNVSLIVDPMLFRKYNVNQVPTFVYAIGMQFDNPGMSEGEENHITRQGKSYMLSGDANLGYVLAKLADESKSETLKNLGGVR